jgi:Fe-S cluster assembly protein SufD
VETFLEALDEPEALLERRREAWRRYAELPMPSTESEEWRYTDVSGLDPEAYTPLGPEAERVADLDELPEAVRRVLDRDQARSAVGVQVNGGFVHRRLDDELAEQGVVFAPVAEVARERPELLEEHLFSSPVAEWEEKLWTLHVALLTNGYVLYVPDGVRVAEPVHTFRWVDRPGALLATHSLVVAGEGAEVTCIDEFLSPDLDEPVLSVNGAEVWGGRNATVRYLSLELFGRGAKHFSIQHNTAGRDTALGGFNVALGGDLSRADVTSHLEGAGGESEMLALWFGSDDQHFDHHTLQHHAAPHAYSDLLYKGALEDEAESVFRGMIRVDEGAQLTDAYQTNRNLLLSDACHATTLPNLEIEADDVRCSHGATVGQVDPSMMFYLMSRGLTRSQAERLLVFGFFDEVLNRMTVEGVRERLREAIEEKIGL